MIGETDGRAAGTGFISTPPGTVLGYRKDGRPIYVIAGGDPRVDNDGQGGGATAPTLTHSQAINRLHDLRTQMGQIAELDSPSEEDDRYFAELRTEFDQVDGHRKKLERDAAMAAVRSTTETLNASGYLRAERGAMGGGRPDPSAGYDRDALLEPDSIEERRFRNPWNIEEMRTFGRSHEAVASEWRARALSACERMQGANDKIRNAATNMIERWDDEDAHLSQLTLALSAPEYLRAWSKLARNGGAVDLEPEERAAVQNVRNTARLISRALSLTDTAGGYLVPFQLDPTVILAANGSVNEIRQLARQVVAIGDTWNGVSAGAVSWSYDAEAAEVSDDSPTFAQPSIPIFKADGFVPISLEAIQDAANITAEVGMLMAEGKDILESNAFAVGTGVAMPTGIVTALGGTSAVVQSTTPGTFAKEDVYLLQDSLPARYRRRAAWLANNSIYSRVRQFGGYDLWGGVGSMGSDNPQQLLGRPHYEAESMDATLNAGVDNDIMIHGDFQNYVIADRIGMTTEFVPHLFGENGLPKNQRGWLAYVRHGADSVNDAAFRMLRVSGTAPVTP